MKYIIRLLVFVLAMTSTAHATERYKTDGGITYFYTPIPDAKKIIFNVYWPHAWPYQKGNNPMTPYIGVRLMLQGGAGGIEPLDMLQKFNEMHASGQLVATRDGIIGTLSLDKNNIDAAAGLIAEVLGHPTLDAKWLKRISSNLRKDQAKANKDIEGQGWNAIRYLDLGTSPYRAYIARDNLEDYDSVTQSDVQNWHRQTFQKTGMIVSVAGPISAADAARAIDKVTEFLPLGKPVRLPAIRLNTSAKRIWLHLPTAKKALVGYTGQIPPNSKGHEVEDLIAVNLLGGGEKSILFKTLRTELRATYGFLTGMSAYNRKTKFIWFSGEVKPDMFAKVDRVVHAAYANFISETPDTAQFNALRNDIAKAIAQNQKRAPVIAFMALESRLDGFKLDRLDTVVSDIQGLKPANLHRHLANSYPKSNQLIQFVVSPNLPDTDVYCVISKPSEAVNCR